MIQSLENFGSKVIQGTQVPMYTKHTLFLYFSNFSIFIFIFIRKKNKQKLKTNKNMLNKAKHKTRYKSMRRKEERKRSIHGDNANVLTKEFKLFAVKRFGKQISLLIISVNKLKSKSTIYDKLPNEVMWNLYVFSLRMLNWILRDVDGTGIVTVNSKMLLTNTIIIEEFLHPKELGAIASSSDVLSFCSG